MGLLVDDVLVVVRAHLDRGLADLVRGLGDRVSALLHHHDVQLGAPLLELDRECQARQAAAHDQDVGLCRGYRSAATHVHAGSPPSLGTPLSNGVRAPRQKGSPAAFAPPPRMCWTSPSGRAPVYARATHRRTSSRALRGWG